MEKYPICEIFKNSEIIFFILPRPCGYNPHLYNLLKYFTFYSTIVVCGITLTRN